MSKEVILTGLRSNSEFHLGNYLGAILPMVNLQKKLAGKYQINMFVPDLHSFTTPIDHKNLYKQTIDNVKVYVAAGLNLDDENTYVYRQSYVSAHSELAWILSCFSYYGEISRMTQFKDKSSRQDSTNDDATKQKSNVTAGLFNYPILMAADILLYDAKWVPLGEDQQQHLELARDVAIRMNNKFDKELFTIPNDWKTQLEFINRDKGARIRSLKVPERKMSKSIDDPAGTIMLSDSPSEAAKKVMSATTDSLQSINLDWEKQPGISNLLQIIALIEEKSIAKVAGEWQGKTNYAELKKTVADLVSKLLLDFQAKLSGVNESSTLAKLAADELKINVIANAKLLNIQKALGLRE